MSVEHEFARLSGTYFAAGGHRPSLGGTTRPVLDPATARELGTIADVTPAEVDEVVAAANAAQAGWWAESALHRSELLHEVARTMRELSPEVAELMTRET